MMNMGDRNDHLRWGFSTSTGILMLLISLLLYFQFLLDIIHFENKLWLFFIGMFFYAIGVFFPDIDHHKTKGGKLLTSLGIKYRHRGKLHSIGALLLYTLACLIIIFGLSFIGGFELAFWIWGSAFLSFLGYLVHLLCDWWFDRKNKTEEGVNRVFKFWDGKQKKKKKGKK